MKPIKMPSLFSVANQYKRFFEKTGLPPGTPVYTGRHIDKPVQITLIDYDEHTFKEETLETVQQYISCKDSPSTSWININGLHDIDVIQQTGQHFDLHPLVLEDIVHVGQRPKFEVYGSYLYIVLKMLRYDKAAQSVEIEQVSLILKDHCLITFQEREGDVFEPIRQRIRSASGRVRKMGNDYLAYALIDAIVDNYFQILEIFGEKIENLEGRLLTHFDNTLLSELHSLRRDLIMLRKSVWATRDLVGDLERSETSLIRPETDVFIRDLYDHTIRLVDTVENFRDIGMGLMDLYLSIVSQRMNEVMKVLTLIATIFIPLSFFAGIFGMNFEYMPELKWRWAYPAGFWILILLVSGGMILYFKRKKWL